MGTSLRGLERYRQASNVPGSFTTYQSTKILPGPFWVISPAIHIYRHEMRDGLPRILSSRVTYVEDGARWEDTRQVPQGIDMRTVGDPANPLGNYKETLDKIHAYAILDSAVHEYGDLGLTQISAFDGLTWEQVNPDELNQYIYPVLCEYLITREGMGSDYVLESFADDDVKKEAEAMGVLKFRRLKVKEAEAKLKAELEADPKKPFRALWLKGIPEIIAAYDRLEGLGNRHLNAVDGAIQQKWRSTYDNFDHIYQKLFARQPADLALQRALTSNHGVTAEAMRAMVQEIIASTQIPAPQVDVEAIVKATAKAILDAQKQVSAPEIVATIEPDPYIDPDPSIDRRSGRPRETRAERLARNQRESRILNGKEEPGDLEAQAAYEAQGGESD